MEHHDAGSTTNPVGKEQERRYRITILAGDRQPQAVAPVDLHAIHNVNGHVI